MVRDYPCVPWVRDRDGRPAPQTVYMKIYRLRQKGRQATICCNDIVAFCVSLCCPWVLYKLSAVGTSACKPWISRMPFGTLSVTLNLLRQAEAIQRYLVISLLSDSTKTIFALLLNWRTARQNTRFPNHRLVPGVVEQKNWVFFVVCHVNGPQNSCDEYTSDIDDKEETPHNFWQQQQKTFF